MNDMDLITLDRARQLVEMEMRDSHIVGGWFTRREVVRRDLIWIALVLVAIITGLVVGAARAETLDGDRIHIIDGDTVALPCDPTKGIYPGCAERVRLLGIDAPEVGSHARCPAELIAGLDAKAALAGLIRRHPVDITRTGRDRYGRTLARLAVGGRSVDAEMLAAGAAIPYAPGRAAWADRCRHWCPGAPRCEE